MKKVISVFLCLVIVVFYITTIFASDKNLLIVQAISGINSEYPEENSSSSRKEKFKKIRRFGKEYSFTSTSEAYEEGKMEGESDGEALIEFCYVIGLLPFFGQIIIMLDPISCPKYLTKNLHGVNRKRFIKGYKRGIRKKRMNASMIGSAVTISVCLLTMLSQ